MRTLSTLSPWVLLNMMHPNSHNKKASKDLSTLPMSASSANICACRKNKAYITLTSELENFNIINFKIGTNMLRNMSHYIPGTVAATSLKGQPVCQLAGAARAAQLPPCGRRRQNGPPGHPAM